MGTKFVTKLVRPRKLPPTIEIGICTWVGMASVSTGICKETLVYCTFRQYQVSKLRPNLALVAES